jgi:hypothetical protein
VIAGLAPYLPPPYTGKEVVSEWVLKRAIASSVTAKAMGKLKLTEEQTADLHGFHELPLPPPPVDVYKAGPREGVWATAPFLHNGSVPNLYEMLIPAKERTKQFYVGREFDPIKVGVETSGKSGDYLLDTPFPGIESRPPVRERSPWNGVIGPLLTDAQRWAIVEHLKSIPEEGGRVTPFGGPAKARTGGSG